MNKINNAVKAILHFFFAGTKPAASEVTAAPVPAAVDESMVFGGFASKAAPIVVVAPAPVVVPATVAATVPVSTWSWKAVVSYDATEFHVGTLTPKFEGNTGANDTTFVNGRDKTPTWGGAVSGPSIENEAYGPSLNGYLLAVDGDPGFALDGDRNGVIFEDGLILRHGVDGYMPEAAYDGLVKAMDVALKAGSCQILVGYVGSLYTPKSKSKWFLDAKGNGNAEATGGVYATFTYGDGGTVREFRRPIKIVSLEVITKADPRWVTPVVSGIVTDVTHNAAVDPRIAAAKAFAADVRRTKVQAHRASFNSLGQGLSALAGEPVTGPTANENPVAGSASKLEKAADTKAPKAAKPKAPKAPKKKMDI